MPGSRATTTSSVDRVGFDHEALLAAQHELVAAAFEGHGGVGRIERSARFADRQAAGESVDGNRAEPAGALLVGAALLHHRHELGDRRQQRTGRDDVSELLGEDRGLDRTEPDAAVLLGDREPGPPERDERVPQRGRARAGLDDRTRQRDRRFLDEHRADRFAQVVLVR